MSLLAFAAAAPVRCASAVHLSSLTPPLTPASAARLSHVVCGRSVPTCTQTLRPPSAPSPPQAKRPFRKPSAAPQLTADGDSVQSTPRQRLLLLTFAAASLGALVDVFSAVHGAVDLGCDLSLILASYVFTDFAVGVYHHAVDNYGSKHTPVVGYQIDAFQGHHKYPWTITWRDTANNLHRLALVATPQLLLALAAPLPPPVEAFYASFVLFVVVSQETHRQAHMTRAAPWVRALQRARIIVTPQAHAAHHRSSGAYAGNYCILSGWWNGVLDRCGFFRVLEAVVFRITGNEPICWRLDASLKADALRRLPAAWR